MTVVKNKKGRYFIRIHPAVEGESLYVTPEGLIKPLEDSLFEKVTTENEEYVSGLQKNRYDEYLRQSKDFGEHREDFGLMRFVLQEYGRSLTLEESAQLRKALEKELDKQHAEKRQQILKKNF